MFITTEGCLSLVIIVAAVVFVIFYRVFECVISENPLPTTTPS